MFWIAALAIAISPPPIPTLTLESQEEARAVVAEAGSVQELGNLDDSASWDFKASDTLQSKRKGAYAAKNVGDGKLETAWVEGKKGNGIGATLTFAFNDRWWSIPARKWHKVDKVVIVNGYLKSKKTWRENGRVKTLAVLHNGKRRLFLSVADNTKVQVIYLGKHMIKVRPGERLSFEIVDVYPGSKYADTAISELVLGVD